MTNSQARFSNSLRRRSDDHDRQRRLTPEYVLEPIRRILGGIGLDPCTEPDNPTGAARFFCLPDDGCAMDWGHDTVFCNPPYGEAKNRWVRRCVEHGQRNRVALLIPASTETSISQFAMAHCDSAILVKARLRFGIPRSNGRQEAASHGSIIYGFGGLDLSPLSDLGVVVVHAKSRTSKRSAEATTAPRRLPGTVG